MYLSRISPNFIGMSPIWFFWFMICRSIALSKWVITPIISGLTLQKSHVNHWGELTHFNSPWVVRHQVLMDRILRGSRLWPGTTCWTHFVPRWPLWNDPRESFGGCDWEAMATSCCHRLWRWQRGEWRFLEVPSGKQPHSYGKSPFLMGKSTINHHFQQLC